MQWISAAVRLPVVSPVSWAYTRRMRWRALALVGALVVVGSDVGAQRDCDPSYPGVCIPPPPPDLGCGDIRFRRFAVVGDDPHGFDHDRDGVGCER